ncbi:MAG TPA: potassium transporter TrkA [Sedimenticola thiotaurini]|uniref:Potassium transporter TrkA n=1 Tax=Sedimenticola thiotaurini TaxID=1543721 RepID=A0A831W7Z8_9GAMM|nr:potassium transporter TrkA [Sedimenticola thiotaurini]
MENIVFLAFRRMRRPLLTLILAYAVATLGLTLIPGQDADGNLWRMDFFHAFYFISFTATTIGFGEIPYEFTDAQRLWVMISLYGLVVVWFYAIGNLLSLVQDRAFQQAVTERRFARRIRRLREPFHLVCGYGETGTALVQTLTERHQHAVVIDIDPDRVNALKLENLREYVPALHGDAARPIHLLEAGLEHPLCQGVVALTNVNEVNLKVAITSKLLHPDIKVICRADSHDIEENMRSFGTDYVVDPFDTFATHLAMALHAPGLYVLQEWLAGRHHQPLQEPVYPPREGHWIVCGYGRFGRAVYGRLRQEGLEPVVVEATPEITGTPQGEYVTGRGTEAVTLEQAGIDQAVGLVAGTDDDANNLSIIMTAQALNPELFIVARQNLQENQRIFQAVQAQVVMHPSSIIANHIRVLLGTPMLYQFMSLAMHQQDSWACELVSRITAVLEDELPEVWEQPVDEEEAWAVSQALTQGQVVTLGDLLRNPRQRERTLPCIPLLLLRDGSWVTLPGEEMPLRTDDRILFCGRLVANRRMSWTLQNEHALNYVLTGEARAQGWIWRRLQRGAAENGNG